MFTKSVDEVRVDAAQVLGVADPHPGPVTVVSNPVPLWARGRGLVLGAEEAAAEPVVAVPHPALLHAVLPAGDQEVVRGAVGVTCLNSALCNVDVDTHINHIHIYFYTFIA